VVILLSSSSVAQIGAIVFGGIAGLWLYRTPAATPSDQEHMSVSRRAGLVALTGFFLLLAGRANAQAVMRGVNAAVVGLLGAALYSPVWTTCGPPGQGWLAPEPASQRASRP
jgi:hypothetical protein